MFFRSTFGSTIGEVILSLTHIHFYSPRVCVQACEHKMSRVAVDIDQKFRRISQQWWAVHFLLKPSVLPLKIKWPEHNLSITIRLHCLKKTEKGHPLEDIP